MWQITLYNEHDTGNGNDNDNDNNNGIKVMVIVLLIVKTVVIWLRDGKLWLKNSLQSNGKKIILNDMFIAYSRECYNNWVAKLIVFDLTKIIS